MLNAFDDVNNHSVLRDTILHKRDPHPWEKEAKFNRKGIIDFGKKGRS